MEKIMKTVLIGVCTSFVLMTILSCVTTSPKPSSAETCPFAIAEREVGNFYPKPDAWNNVVQELSGKLVSSNPNTVAAEYSDFGYKLEINGDTYVLRSTTPASDVLNYWKTYFLSRNGNLVLTFRVFTNSLIDDINAFYRYGNNWVIDYKGGAILNRKSLAPSETFDDVFFYHFEQDVPFFFFRKGERFGFQYGEERCWLPYTRIVHDVCCEKIILNPRSYGDRVVIFAERGGKWLGAAIILD